MPLDNHGASLAANHTKRKPKMTQDTIARIKTYSKPSAQQRLLLELDAKPTKTSDDLKKTKALMAAEVAAEKAAAAKAAAAGVLRDIAKAEAKAIRNARTHELCESAGLMALAGLVDKMSGKPTRDLGELLGGLLNLASISDPAILGQWKRKGDAMLAGKVPVPPSNGALLKTTFADKDEVKHLGAVWNATAMNEATGKQGAWEVPAGVDLRPFSKWL